MTTAIFTNVGSSGTISNGGLTYAGGMIGLGWGSATTDASFLSTGKFYFEFVQDVLASNPYDAIVGLGNASANINNYAGNDGNSFGLQSNGGLLGGVSGTTESWVTGNTVMIAYDLSAGKIWLGVNGTWAGGGNPAAGTGGCTWSITGALAPIFSNEVQAQETANFGASAYTYTVPSGFSSVPTAIPPVTSSVHSQLCIVT